MTATSPPPFAAAWQIRAETSYRRHRAPLPSAHSTVPSHRACPEPKIAQPCAHYNAAPWRSGHRPLAAFRFSPLAHGGARHTAQCTVRATPQLGAAPKKPSRPRSPDDVCEGPIPHTLFHLQIALSIGPSPIGRRPPAPASSPVRASTLAALAGWCTATRRTISRTLALGTRVVATPSCCTYEHLLSPRSPRSPAAAQPERCASLEPSRPSFSPPHSGDRLQSPHPPWLPIRLKSNFRHDGSSLRHRRANQITPRLCQDHSATKPNWLRRPHAVCPSPRPPPCPSMVWSSLSQQDGEAEEVERAG